MERRSASVCMGPLFTLIFYPFFSYKATLQKLEKEKLGHKTSYKSVDLQFVLPAGCAGTMAMQNMWELATSVWFNKLIII